MPNFRRPKDLSEIILSKMHTKEFLSYSVYADKVLVRDYVKRKGLESSLLQVYGVWDDANAIKLEDLPNKFALKPNNGSGGHFFCKDSSRLSIDEFDRVKRRLNDSLKLDEHEYAYEPHYKLIEPRIYCEELIDTGTDAWPTDYKFTCVRGKVQDVFVCCERESGHTKYCTMSPNDWSILPYTKKEFLPSKYPAKPALLNEMVRIAEILSADFDVVRVDLYEYNSKVIFGELTFSPWGGLMYSYTNESLELMGREYYK